jgi:hypothetical protein
MLTVDDRFCSDQSSRQGTEPNAVALARAVSSARIANLRRENARRS